MFFQVSTWHNIPILNGSFFGSNVAVYSQTCLKQAAKG